MYKRVFLHGTLDDANPLSKIRENGLVISKIFQEVDDYYKRHIRRDEHAYAVMPFYRSPFHLGMTTFVEFPLSKGININMMPFRLFDNKTLPNMCKQYIPVIDCCRRFIPYCVGRIAYLTIHESDVFADTSQRRPGLHIDSPVLPSSTGYHGRIIKYNPNDPEYRCYAWGLGSFTGDAGFPVDGIYVASSVADTTKVWDSIVEHPEDIADEHGGVECLRPFLGEGRTLAANELCWLTDRTPHESLPVIKDTHRQFFRLVVGKIDIWYSQHNTPNPLGVQPDAQIVDTNKFNVLYK
jgi:hypothetical protein